ncbi:TOR1B-like protein [Mya arenaria]|uniref:TOR1B-like protein n=1 Tax=Mya arenaria TaxID=6604 RepID=A0ABY7DMN0_MYAAR|nr:TOR1B-like protein [Mya arenaria]
MDVFQHAIKQHIVATVRACPESLVIFDKMDKMPSGIMDVVKPFLEYNQPVEGTNYRHSVFLCLRLVNVHSHAACVYLLWNSVCLYM